MPIWNINRNFAKIKEVYSAVLKYDNRRNYRRSLGEGRNG